MAGASDIRAGRAYVEVTAKDAGLQAGLARAIQRVERFGAAARVAGTAIAAVGGVASAAFAVAGKTFADSGEQLLRMSQRTGVAVEALSTLKFAAGQTGADVEQLQAALLKMDRTLTEAAGGSAEARLALSRLGVSVGDLADLSGEARFKLLADRLSAVSDPAVRAGLATQVFGRGVVDILPLLAMGSSGIDALQARARELGLQWSTVDAEAAGRFGAAMRELWAVVDRGVSVVGSAMVPRLQELTRTLTVNAGAAMRWVSDHKGLIATAGAVAGAVAGIGVGLVVVGTVIEGTATVAGVLAGGLGLVASAASAVAGLVGGVLSAAFGLAGTAAGLFGTVVTGVFTAIPAIGAAVLGIPGVIAGAFTAAAGTVAAAWAAVTAPAFLVGAAVVAVGAAAAYLGGQFLVSSGIAGRAFAAVSSAAAGAAATTGRVLSAAAGQVATAFRAVRDHLAAVWAGVQSDALAAFGGVRDALRAGDWQTAAEIVWTAIKLSFNRAVLGLWDPLLPGFYHAVAYVRIGWADTMAAVRTVWATALEYLSNWDGIKTGAAKVFEYLRNAWSAVTDFLADKFADVLIDHQAKVDVQAKFKGVTIDNALADQLAGPEAKEAADRVRRRTDLTDDQKQQQADAAIVGVRDRYRQRFVGRQLDEHELQDAIDAETKVRRDAAASMARKRDQQRTAEYDQRQSQLDKNYAAKRPDVVAEADAARRQAEVDRQAAVADAERQLAAALKSIDPGRAERVAELEKELARLRAVADAEAKAARDKQAALDKRVEDAEAKAGKGDGGDAAAGLEQDRDRGGGHEELLKSGAYLDQSLANEIFGGGGTGGTVQQRIAEATERTADNTDPKAAVPADGGPNPAGLARMFQTMTAGLPTASGGPTLDGSHRNAADAYQQFQAAADAARRADVVGADPQKLAALRAAAATARAQWQAYRDAAGLDEGSGQPFTPSPGSGLPIPRSPDGPTSIDQWRQTRSPDGPTSIDQWNADHPDRPIGGLAGVFRSALNGLPPPPDVRVPDGAGMIAGLNAAASSIFGGSAAVAGTATAAAAGGSNGADPNTGAMLSVLQQMLQVLRDGSKGRRGAAFG